MIGRLRLIPWSAADLTRGNLPLNPDGRGVGGRLCPTRDAVSRYWQVTPLNFIRWIPSFGSDRRSLSISRHTSELVRAQLAPGPPSGGALDVVQVRGCVTI